MPEDRSSIDIVRESKTLAYMVGAVMLAAGLVLLLWPDRTITVVARLAGVLLVVLGAGDLLDTVRHHRGTSPFLLLFVRALVNLGFGLALVFWPGITVNVVVWLIGLDFVLAGILGLVVRSSLPEDLRSGTMGRSLVTIAIGVALMVWPDATLSVVTFLMAAFLILGGLVMLWTGHQVSKVEHQVAV